MSGHLGRSDASRGAPSMPRGRGYGGGVNHSPKEKKEVGIGISLNHSRPKGLVGFREGAGILRSFSRGGVRNVDFPVGARMTCPCWVHTPLCSERLGRLVCRRPYEAIFFDSRPSEMVFPARQVGVIRCYDKARLASPASRGRQASRVAVIPASPSSPALHTAAARPQGSR